MRYWELPTLHRSICTSKPHDPSTLLFPPRPPSSLFLVSYSWGEEWPATISRVHDVYLSRFILLFNPRDCVHPSSPRRLIIALAVIVLIESLKSLHGHSINSATMEDSIRNTQRAPLSCISCYKRKVKCDKKIPCGQCIRRGATSTCRREQVKVKGQLIQ